MIPPTAFTLGLLPFLAAGGAKPRKPIFNRTIEKPLSRIGKRGFGFHPLKSDFSASVVIV